MSSLGKPASVRSQPSQGSVRSPQPQMARRTRSIASPSHSNGSGRSIRLSSVIHEYRERHTKLFDLSPLARKSVLTDNTDLEEPRRTSWWMKLENSRHVMEVLENNKAEEPNNIIEELDIEVPSPGKEFSTLESLPESSASESIKSIVLPQRKLFTEKENRPQKRFGQFGTRDTLPKLYRTNFTGNRTVSAASKELFPNKPRSRPRFPAAFPNMSPYSTTGDKTLTAVEPEGQVRNIFGNRHATKRKNIFANFIVSESEDEIPEIHAKVFNFRKHSDLKRRPSFSRGIRDHSPSSSITTDLELDDWKLLPSSTMAENQLEAMISSCNTPKRSKLSKLSENKESDTATNSTKTERTKQSNESTASKNKSKTMTKEKSTGHNIFVSSKNRSNLSPDDDKQVNKSQGRQNISQSTSARSSGSNKSQSSIVTRSKSESGVINRKQSASIDKSRNNSSKAKNTSKTSPKLTKSVSNRIQVKESEPVPQDADDELNFTLEYDSVDSADEVYIQKEANQENMNVINKSNKQANNSKSISRRENTIRSFSKTNKSIEKTVANKIVEISTVSEMLSKDIEKNIVSIKEKPNSNTQTTADSRDHANKEATANDDEIKVNEIGEKEKEYENQEVQNKTEEHENESKAEDVEQESECEAENGEDENIDNQEVENQSEEFHEQPEIECDDDNETDVEQETESEAEQEKVSEVEDVEQESGSGAESEEQENISEAENEDDANIDSQEVENKSKEFHEQSEIECDDGNEMEVEQETESENEQENWSEAKDEEQENMSETENDDDPNIDSEEVENKSGEVGDQIEVECDYKTSGEEAAKNDQSYIQENESDQQAHSDQENENDYEIDSDRADNQEKESDQEGDSDQNDSEDDDKQQDSEEIDTETTNVSHDTTGRNGKKDESPEVGLCNTKNQIDYSIVHGRNTSVRKTRSIINNLNIQPILSDRTEDTSTEGSGWDSHRTTRKTLRQTFGKDFTPRKSLRALVMEKSVKRQTMLTDTTSVTAKFPQANSTELPHESARHDNDTEMYQEPQGSDHEVSRKTRQATLETYVQMAIQQNKERSARLDEKVKNSLKAPPRDVFNSFKAPARPKFPQRPTSKTTKPKAMRQIKTFLPLEELPEEIIQDLMYKPPKRFQPSNAAWITKKLYKFLETKLEPKYDYRARVRAERLVEMIYNLTKQLRRRGARAAGAADSVERELARLGVLRTHVEFYDFIRTFLPREFRIKVIPDAVNQIPHPRRGIFSDILERNTAQE